ncbi:MAG: ATP-binding protein, partial [Acidobacteriota bacterium]|nr:ATP-binding protein [Acidobacteriota bacterium]
MATHKPFFVGGPVPVSHFKGRERALNSAVDQILNSGHLALYGEPGIGKSSFLKYLIAPQVWRARMQDPNSMIFVYLNCTMLNPFDPKGFWFEVLNLLKIVVTQDATLEAEVDRLLAQDSVGRREVSQFLNFVGPKGKRLVLLLDDYDQVLQAHAAYTEADMLAFLYELRSLAVADQAGEYLSIIVSTFRRLDEMGPRSTLPSPWYNHYLFRPLRPFSYKETETLLDVMPKEWRLTEEHRVGLQEICDGHPALIQNACSLIYDSMNNEEQPSFDIEHFTRDFISSTEQFFRNTWKLSNEAEQMLMMLIALSNLNGRLNEKRSYNLSDVDIILSQMDRELRILEERGILQRKEGDGRVVYSFASSIME